METAKNIGKNFLMYVFINSLLSIISCCNNLILTKIDFAINRNAKLSKNTTKLLKSVCVQLNNPLKYILLVNWN